MKKFKAVGLAALVAVGLVACGEEETTKSVSDAKVTETKEKVAEEPKPEPKKEEPKSDPIEIANDDSFKITLMNIVLVEDTEFEDKYWEVIYEIENKTDKDVEVQGGTVSADSKMVDEMLYGMSQEIAAGKKADAVLTIQNYDDPDKLPELKENFEMTLDIFDWDYTIEKTYDVVVEMNK